MPLRTRGKASMACAADIFFAEILMCGHNFFYGLCCGHIFCGQLDVRTYFFCFFSLSVGHETTECYCQKQSAQMTKPL